MYYLGFAEFSYNVLGVLPDVPRFSVIKMFLDAKDKEGIYAKCMYRTYYWNASNHGDDTYDVIISLPSFKKSFQFT